MINIGHKTSPRSWESIRTEFFVSLCVYVGMLVFVCVCVYLCMKHDLFKLSQEETVSTESEVCCIDYFVSSSSKQLPLHFDLS